MKHTLILSAAVAVISMASCTDETTNSAVPGTGSTAAPAESKAERNKKVIMKCVEAINTTHDAGKLAADMAPGYTEYQDGSMPPVKGDSATQALQQYLTAFPDMKIGNSRYYADDNSVVVVSDFTLTFKNDLGPIKATGKSTTFKDVDIFTLDDNGKVLSHRNIYPNGAIFQQLGVDMAKMQAMMEKEMKK